VKHTPELFASFINVKLPSAPAHQRLDALVGAIEVAGAVVLHDAVRLVTSSVMSQMVRRSRPARNWTVIRQSEFHRGNGCRARMDMK
jgi:hypothetical protein